MSLFDRQQKWQEELRERREKQRQQALQKKRRKIAQRKTVLAKEAAVLSGVKPVQSWRYIDPGNDGHYLVILFLSLTADLAGMVIGLIETGVSWIPFAGWLADIFLEGLEIFLYVGFAAAILTLYFLAGHFKDRLENKVMANSLRLAKIASIFGFDLLEILPSPLSILPFFTAAFFVNYYLVLRERAVQAVEKKEIKKADKTTLKII